MLSFLAMQLPEGFTPNLHLMIPEFIVAGTALGAILPELLLPAGRRAAATAWTSLAGLAIAFVVVVAMGPSDAMALHMKDGAFDVTGWKADSFSVFCRALTAIGGVFLVLMSIPYTRRMDRGHGEFYALLLFALLGVMLVAGVSDLLSMFVCLELVTIMAYILAALRRNDMQSTEAGLKYLVIGAVSTAILLLGIGLVYGAVGNLSFAGLEEYLLKPENAEYPAILVMGIAFVLIGLFFKIGGVPFHVWIPDVYQGAPSPATAFLITASKFAGVILLLRFGEAALLPALKTVDAFSWVILLGVVSVITLLFGVLGAIPQRSIKRLLAYSSIGHAGYILMAIAAVATEGGSGAQKGTSALLYYMMAYFATSITAFAVIITVSAAAKSHGHEAYTGLARRAPFLAVAMALSLFSLAGVPPMAGFFGKFLILQSVVDKGLYVLAFVGAGAVIVSLYFYMLWIKEMYIRKPEEGVTYPSIHVPGVTRFVLWAGMIAMLALGVWMGPFYEWVHEAATSIAAVGT
ncbi:MAG: NADH-quinone oxidoreductase subunit N [Planctomycetota bacterium]|nr:NADH-quinone oxidoreductase subunit N [Planctomycetota bacterium]